MPIEFKIHGTEREVRLVRLTRVCYSTSRQATLYASWSVALISGISYKVNAASNVEKFKKFVPVSFSLCIPDFYKVKTSPPRMLLHRHFHLREFPALSSDKIFHLDYSLIYRYTMWFLMAANINRLSNKNNLKLNFIFTWEFSSIFSPTWIPSRIAW